MKLIFLLRHFNPTPTLPTREGFKTCHFLTPSLVGRVGVGFDFFVLFFVISLLFSTYSSSFAKSYLIIHDGSINNYALNSKFPALNSKKVFKDELFADKKINNRLLSSNQQNLLSKLQNYIVVNIDEKNQDNILSDLSNQSGIIEILPNTIFTIDKIEVSPNDPEYSKQWNLKQINIEKAWQKATGKGVIVGVIDTGVDFEHPDIKPNLWINSAEDINHNGTFEPWSVNEVRNGVTGDFDGIDNDHNGYIDDVIGYDFVDQETPSFGDYHIPDPIPEDEGEHGTNVIGVIAAKANNQIGIAGVAFDAKILMAKAFDITGNAESDDIAKAIVYAVMNGAKVLNFSFGDDYPSPIVYDAIKFAYSMGTVMFASSGNNGWYQPHFPSDHPEVISVGASNDAKSRWSLSNYGSFLDIIAPGSGIYTTAVGGQYKFASGTSLSAPHASGVAALILELNPDLTPNEVKSIMQTNAEDIGDKGWDIESGSGIIDAGKCVNNMFAGKIVINEPNQGTNFNLFKIKDFVINLTVENPLFESFQINIGNGLIPTQWFWSSQVYTEQVFNKYLDTIPLNQFLDDNYILSVKVNLKNNKTIEERILFRTYSIKNQLAIKKINTFNIFKAEKKVVLVAVEASIPGEFLIRYKPTGSNEEYKIIKEYERQTNFHEIIIEDVPADVDYFGQAVIYNGSDTITKDFNFKRSSDYFNTANFDMKPYSCDRAYLYNGMTDIYGDGKKTFVVNDLKNLYIGKTKVVEFNTDKFEYKDSLDIGYIPVGYGDSNGDGIPEIMTSAEFNTILYQSKTKNGNPFEKELFRNPEGSSLWGEQMYDLDGDGKQEIIGYRFELKERCYIAFKYDNGTYNELARAELPSNLKNVNIERGSAIGDFDNDGKSELAIVNTRGNIIIYEFSNNTFNVEFVDSTNIASSNQYVARADIDGDGIFEILHGSAGTELLFNFSNAGNIVWNFRILKSTAPNTYEYVWNEMFYPVKQGSTRQGVFFRNGVAAGDLNNKPGDEIVISTFPNLYVFTWNKTLKKMDRLWYYPSTLSNSALIADIDGNGKNELGFTTFNALRFFEYNDAGKRPTVPENIDGWSESKYTAKLKWKKSTDAVDYHVYQLVEDSLGIMALEVGVTVNDSILIDNLPPYKYYDFVMNSQNNSFPEPYSDYSNIITIYTSDKIKVIEAFEPNENNVKIRFSGIIGTNNLEPGIFKLSKDGNDFFPQSVIIISDSIAVLNFEKNLDSGDYLVSVNSFRDFYRNYTFSGDVSFSNKPVQKDDEIFLLKLVFTSETLLDIYFSEPVELVTSQIRDNYVMKPLGEVLFVERSPTDSSKVSMNISQFIRYSGARGKDYTITVNNVIANNGHKMTKGAGNTLGFVISMDDLRDAYVYPNPIKYSENPEIYFAGLTREATITVTTLDGIEIIKLDKTNGNGGIEWDGKDRNGNNLPTGIYLFKAEGINKDGIKVFSETKKFVILP
jgi:hypothetical protein